MKASSNSINGTERPPTIRHNNSLSVNIRMIEIKKRLFHHSQNIYPTFNSISNRRNSRKILSPICDSWTICSLLSHFSFLHFLSGHCRILFLIFRLPLSFSSFWFSIEKRAVIDPFLFRHGRFDRNQALRLKHD